MLRNVSIWCVVALFLLTAACNRQSAETEQQPVQETAPATTPTVASPSPAAVSTKKGTVVETMDSGNYTYILVDDGAQQTWVALLKSPVEVGQEIAYYDGMVMENFVSKTLDRTFDKIIFSNGLVGEDAGDQPPLAPQTAEVGEQQPDSFAEALEKESQSMAASQAPVMPPGSRKAIVPFAEIQVEKAVGENSYTVGEVYEKAAELNGKTVKVRGKVMKVSPHIMGKNWIHLQDGSGDPASSTHDLVVTTITEPEDAWDVITVSGVVSANKDFGAGYKYAVIVEQAEITN